MKVSSPQQSSSLDPVLPRIASPADLKNLTLPELNRLARDVRDRINEVVREVGGHLGPNLGAVELITALHRVFDLDRDRLVFDVGHQSYAHKILTGRFESFATLRQEGGMSGYPHPAESIYDTFRGGHASTSVSTALGWLQAMQADPATADRKVIALIGDGSLTGGMAFEGLNHAGHLGLPLIVVVNDNSMSISPTVGALSNYFNKIRHLPPVQRIGNDVTDFVTRVPGIGKTLRRWVKLVSRQSRHLLNPGQFFIDLGFDYLGPIDGNNIEDLLDALTLAKKSTSPIWVHALTKKGLGYRIAPGAVEISGPHALAPGQRKKEESTLPPPPASAPSWSAVFANTLADLAEKDDRVVAITAAMEEGTALDSFRKRHPNRVVDVGICEQHATGFAAGLAAGGKRPVFAVYSTFLQRAIDQVFHDVVLQGDLPVLFCIDRAGVVGDDGPSHHGLYDIGYLRPFPHLIQMSPRDASELRLMMEFALGQNRPCAIRYPREAVPAADLFPALEPLVLGKFQILRSGTDVALLAYGPTVAWAWAAAERLVESGLSVSVVNARFAKPLLAGDLADLARSHRALVTIEEGALAGGFGSGVLESLSEQGALPAKFRRLGFADLLVEHAPRARQLKTANLSPEGIAESVKTLFEGVSRPNG